MAQSGDLVIKPFEVCPLVVEITGVPYFQNHQENDSNTFLLKILSLHCHGETRINQLVIFVSPLKFPPAKLLTKAEIVREQLGPTWRSRVAMSLPALSSVRLSPHSGVGRNSADRRIGFSLRCCFIAELEKQLESRYTGWGQPYRSGSRLRQWLNANKIGLILLR